MHDAVILLLVIALLTEQWRRAVITARLVKAQAQLAELTEVKAQLYQLNLLADTIRQDEIILGGHNMHYCSIYNPIRLN